jgi:hypothetical protein
VACLSEKENLDPWGRYKIEIVIIKDGINDHIFRRLKGFPYTLRNNSKDYKITIDGLFKKDLTILQFIRNLTVQIFSEHMIFFWEGETKPIKRFETKVSPRVLKVARHSNAVTGMIKEWFSGKGFPINKWVFILVVASIGTIIYAKYTGMI